MINPIFCLRTLVTLFISSIILTALPVYGVQLGYVTDYFANNVIVLDVETNHIDAVIPTGKGPMEISLSPDKSLGYVTNFMDNSVTAIDIIKNTVITTITKNIGIAPSTIIFAPNGKKAYAANSGDDFISVIDVETNKAKKMIMGLSALSIAISANSKILYIASSLNTIEIFNACTFHHLDTIPVNTSPSQIIISPSGKYAYVSSSGDSSVSVIDLTKKMVVASIPVGIQPLGLCIMPDGATLYVANLQDNSISVIDTASNTVTDTVLLGFSPIFLTAFGNELIYVTNYSQGTVNVIARSTNTIIDSFSAGTSPTSISFTPLLQPECMRLKKTNEYSTGCSIKQTVTWIESPDPLVTQYELYREGLLIATIPSSFNQNTHLKYMDTFKRSKNNCHTHYILYAQSLNGSKSYPVTPSK